MPPKAQDEQILPTREQGLFRQLIKQYEVGCCLNSIFQDDKVRSSPGIISPSPAESRKSRFLRFRVLSQLCKVDKEQYPLIKNYSFLYGT